MDNLDIVVETSAWESIDLEPLAATACETTLRFLALPPDLCDVTILACDDAAIAALNATHRNKPTPTNVLSWPAAERGAATPGGAPLPPTPDPDGTLPLGDIALAYETCAAEAEEAGTPMRHHTTHLIVHGVLHLLGYDHETDPDAALMEGLEVKILGKMGLDNPYRVSQAE
ncbi:rRNA maturation RNase YbeY [uncultured Sulfitobacter sp.]|uniref:rRNA maturation RNase YbeY n=1 Tax=uncultured Sulfitobacter sp. TaxID=191468 RepID=UPI00261462F1|nr:rRNA maturation RNase YbeY [uncultured Sulfitobacter sp.]